MALTVPLMTMKLVSNGEMISRSAAVIPSIWQSFLVDSHAVSIPSSVWQVVHLAYDIDRLGLTPLPKLEPAIRMRSWMGRIVIHLAIGSFGT